MFAALRKTFCMRRSKKRLKTSEATSLPSGGDQIETKYDRTTMSLRSSFDYISVPKSEQSCDDNRVDSDCDGISGKKRVDSTAYLEEESKKEHSEIVDPITLEMIPEGNRISLNGNSYDIITLVNYLFQSKDFRDPLSMENLTEEQIAWIDMKAFDVTTMGESDAPAAPKVRNDGKSKIALQIRLDLPSPRRPPTSSPIPSVIPPSPFSPITTSPRPDGSRVTGAKSEKASAEDIKRDKNEKTKEKEGDEKKEKPTRAALPTLLPLFRKVSAGQRQDHQRAVQTYDTIIGGMMSEIMDLIEEDAENEMEEFSYTIMRIISELEWPWGELKRIDSQAAFLYLQSYKAFLRGPEKKRTHDPNNRLTDILLTLDRTCLTQDDRERHIKERKARSLSFDIDLEATPTEVVSGEKRSRSISC